MVYLKMTEYTFKGFRRSPRKFKKYDAILKNKKTDRVTHMPFGDMRYSQYKDTALGIYSSKNHLDKTRQKSYKARHKGFLRKGYYSPSYFSWFFLWT